MKYTWFLGAWTWIRKNSIALMFALLAGCLSIAPHLLAVHALGNAYQGIPFLMSDNEDYYLARIHEITDGHGTVASPYFFEYKDTLPVVPTIGEYLYVILGVIGRLSPVDTLLYAKFLFPLLLFLLVYTLIRKISEHDHPTNGNMWGAIAGASLIVMGFDLADYHALFERLIGSTSSQRILSPWVRPVNPITGALFLFTYLHFTWRSIREQSWFFPVTAGILIALSLGYVFTVALELTILGLLIILFSVTKELSVRKRLIAIGLVGMSIASLYWLKVLETLSSGSDMAGKNGLMHTHAPLLNKVLLAAALVISLLLFISHRKDSFRSLTCNNDTALRLWFPIILVASSFIVLNQQVLTGITIWPYHFTQYTNPLAIISLFSIGYTVLRPRCAHVWKLVVSLTIIASVSFATWNASTYVFAMNEFRSFQDLSPALTWLNTHTEKDSVVLVLDDDNEILTGFIPGFTSCNVYQTKNFVSGSTPAERVLFNFFVLLRMRGIDATHIEPYLAAHQDLVLRYFYTDYQELFGLVQTDHIARITPHIADEYRQFLKNDLVAELKQYRIDYVLTRKALPPETMSALSGHLFPLFRGDSTTIYAFK